MLQKLLLLNNLLTKFRRYLLVVLGLCLGLNLNAALKLPYGYFGIKLGITPGFNHHKFTNLKTNYLQAVNHEIAIKFANQNIDLRDPLNIEKIRLSNLANPANIKYHALRDQSLYKIIAICLQQNKVNLEHVTICKSDINSQYRMQVWLGSDPQKVYLQINSKIIQDLKSVKNSAQKRAANQLFQSAITHEASHIIHQDLAVRLLLKTDQQIILFTKLAEKRADLFSVFNSPNPLGVATYLSNQVPRYNNFYDHRCDQDWSDLIKNLESCYESTQLKKAINNQITVCSKIRKYQWPKVIHILE